uniref:LHFPL tetraspan subfamily member 2a n=1 Tax=Eptatretus burgeri TaxID=7764 RepID=A0A8C4QQH6_EPTBU
MCHIIITCRSLLWSVLSVLVSLAEISACLSPRWLSGSGGGTHSLILPSSSPLSVHRRTTLGLYNRCLMRHGTIEEELCGPYAASFWELASTFWQATTIFLGVGVLILTMVALLAPISLCRQSIFHKSIFNICGLLQAIAGLFLILGMLLYPAGWGSERVENICGRTSAPYQVGACSLGWPFYMAIAGIVGTFGCALLSTQAEQATSGDDVQDEIDKGNILICLL